MVLFVLLSGCRIDFGEYRISGSVTTANGTPVYGAIIKYQKNYSSNTWVVNTLGDSWSIRANKGDRLTIWAEKSNYRFQPTPYNLVVDGDRRDVNFKVSGWYDDFSSTQSKWDVKNYGDGCWHNYDAQGFRIYISAISSDDILSVTSPIDIPYNYTVTATMEPVSGSGMLGLVFNVKDFNVGSFYYIFRIKPGTEKGYWELVKATKTSYGTTNTVRLVYGESDIITPDLNIVSVTQDWNRAILSINNEVIEEVYIDTHAEPYLMTGLHATKDLGWDYYAWFDDFNITANGFRLETTYGLVNAPSVGTQEPLKMRSDKSTELTE